jgi:hypothetical protein
MNASVEEFATVIGGDIDGIIDYLNLPRFGGGQAVAENLRTPLTKYKKVFVPMTALVTGPDFDIKRIHRSGRVALKWRRRASRLTRCSKETCIREKSTSPFATNNVIVPRKVSPDGYGGRSCSRDN